MTSAKAFDLAEKLSSDLMAASTKLDIARAETQGAREECERLKHTLAQTVSVLSKDIGKLRREALESARAPAEDTEALRRRISDLVESEALAWAAGKETTDALARMIKERDEARAGFGKYKAAYEDEKIDHGNTHRATCDAVIRAQTAEARIAQLEAEGTARAEAGAGKIASGSFTRTPHAEGR